MDMPKPGAEHRKLEIFTGAWRGEEIMHPSPWSPEGGRAQGQSDSRLDLNGFAVITEYQQKQGGVTTFSGHGVTTWNAAEQCYVLHWFDCMGTPPEIFRGNFEGDILTMTSEGPMGRMRYTSDYSTPGALRTRMDMSSDGKTWQTLFEGDYRRS